MADFEVEMTMTTGRGAGIVKSVIVHDCAKPELAKVLGIEELLLWTEEDNSPIPPEALGYWRSARSNGNVMIYEALSELETKWNLTFTIQDVSKKGAPAPRSLQTRALPSPSAKAGAPPTRQAFDLKTLLAAQLEELRARRKELAASAKAGVPPAHPGFDLKAMLAAQLEMLQVRQMELAQARKEIDREWSENTAALADIRNFLLVSAGRRRPKRKLPGPVIEVEEGDRDVE